MPLTSWTIRSRGHISTRLCRRFGYTDYPSAAAAEDDDYRIVGNLGSTIRSLHLRWRTSVSAPSRTASQTPASSIPVSGTASYSGYTSGTALKDGAPTRDNLDDSAYWDSRYFDFLGQVNLRADFAAASVRGHVNDFQQILYGEPGEVEHDFLKNLSIDLEDASIASGTFTGDARATGLAGAVGKWGGQFFGTPDSTGEAPPAVGGTWGVTQGTGDNDWKMLGGFGSWKP